MKRWIPLLLAAALLLGAAGCTQQKGGTTVQEDQTAVEFVSGLGVGWNLGNSLDALGTGLTSETAWGNPKTTQQMILDVKAMGFDVLRVPVSWGLHCDGDGTVDPAWMARVKEVVDYGYNNGMTVILNSHHDCDYYDIGGCAESEETLAASVTKMKKLWEQIAETFRDYDTRLIFETLNEPRTIGSPNEWSGGLPSEQKVVDRLNREILETIRSSGGNNPRRFVMMPAYAATPNLNTLMAMELPEDDRIIVSVHAYSPYNFAMNAEGSAQFTDSDRRELDSFFENLNLLFVKKGIPVILGEFGATNKNNLEDRCAWAEYYVQGAGKFGIPCVVWDNNDASAAGAEMFGLYDRARGEWYFPELAKAYTDAARTPAAGD